MTRMNIYQQMLYYAYINEEINMMLLWGPNEEISQMSLWNIGQFGDACEKLQSQV